MFTLDRVVPWGRSYGEYRRMFDLSDDDVRRGRILGCADGPASFNAEGTATGARVVSCDPLYQFPAATIRERIDATSADVLEQTRRHADTFVWRDISSIDELARVRHAAMDAFLRDFSAPARRQSYVAASLPFLPFPTDTFVLAVCSHFLFLYSDHFDERFHVDAVFELCRVARDVRIFPLLTLAAARSPHLDGVANSLEDRGFAVSIQRVPYEFQRGSNLMLRIVRR